MKYYKKYFFRNDIGGITFVPRICDDLCMLVYMYNHHILNTTSGHVCRQSSSSDAYSTSNLSGGWVTFDMLQDTLLDLWLSFQVSWSVILKLAV